MTDEIDRTLPKGTVFLDKRKLRYPEEIMADRIEQLNAEVERLRNDSAKAVMAALWPVLGGNHTDAELWHEINDAVRAALAARGLTITETKE